MFLVWNNRFVVIFLCFRTFHSHLLRQSASAQAKHTHTHTHHRTPNAPCACVVKRSRMRAQMRANTPPSAVFMRWQSAEHTARTTVSWLSLQSRSRSDGETATKLHECSRHSFQWYFLNKILSSSFVSYVRTANYFFPSFLLFVFFVDFIFLPIHFIFFFSSVRVARLVKRTDTFVCLVVCLLLEQSSAAVAAPSTPPSMLLKQTEIKRKFLVFRHYNLGRYNFDWISLDVLEMTRLASNGLCCHFLLLLYIMSDDRTFAGKNDLTIPFLRSSPNEPANPFCFIYFSISTSSDLLNHPLTLVFAFRCASITRFPLRTSNEKAKQVNENTRRTLFIATFETI